MAAALVHASHTDSAENVIQVSMLLNCILNQKNGAGVRQLRVPVHVVAVVAWYTHSYR